LAPHGSFTARPLGALEATVPMEHQSRKHHILRRTRSSNLSRCLQRVRITHARLSKVYSGVAVDRPEATNILLTNFPRRDEATRRNTNAGKHHIFRRARSSHLAQFLQRVSTAPAKLSQVYSEAVVTCRQLRAFSSHTPAWRCRAR
jgi:hypothetical protein